MRANAQISNVAKVWQERCHYILRMLVQKLMHATSFVFEFKDSRCIECEDPRRSNGKGFKYSQHNAGERHRANQMHFLAIWTAASVDFMKTSTRRFVPQLHFRQKTYHVELGVSVLNQHILLGKEMGDSQPHEEGFIYVL